MFIYILAIIIAGFIQIGTIYLLKENIFKSIIYVIPLILIFQFLFLWSYSNAPKFITIWFIATALTNSLAFLAGYFIWKEHLSSWNFIGIVFILVGIIFLRFK